MLKYLTSEQGKAKQLEYNKSEKAKANHRLAKL